MLCVFQKPISSHSPLERKSRILIPVRAVIGILTSRHTRCASFTFKRCRHRHIFYLFWQYTYIKNDNKNTHGQRDPVMSTKNQLIRATCIWYSEAYEIQTMRVEPSGILTSRYSRCLSFLIMTVLMGMTYTLCPSVYVAVRFVLLVPYYLFLSTDLNL